MDNVNVGVQVPATNLNSTPTSAITPQSSGGSNGGTTNSQISSSESATITAASTRSGGKILPTNSGKGDLAIFAIIFIIIAVIIFALVYRNQLLRFWQTNFKKK